MNTQNLIHEFLTQRRFAFVGVSRKAHEFSRSLFREFVKRGYDAVPVNPHAKEIEGKLCAPSVKEVQPAVKSALLLIPKYAYTAAIHECAEAGVTLLWLYGVGGSKDVPDEALEECTRRGIQTIPGYCPYMFLDKSAWYHHFHGTVMKMFGSYPA